MASPPLEADRGSKSTRNLFSYFEFDKKEDTPHEIRTILLTIFTLIAAATFQAGVNPPGGIWQDHDENEHNGHKAGMAIYSSQKMPYYVFLFSNTSAFSNSILVILSLTHKFPFKFEIRAATLSMAVTYASAIFAVSPDQNVKFRYVLIIAFIPFVLRLLISIYYQCYPKDSTSGPR